MKTFTLSLFLLSSLSGCELVDPDPCEDTVLLPSITGELVYEYSLYERPGVPTNNEMKVRFEKIVCGMSNPTPSSRIEYTGVMGVDGFFLTGSAIYNIRNKEDIISVTFWSKVGSDWSLHDSEEMTYENFQFMPAQIRKYSITLNPDPI